MANINQNHLYEAAANHNVGNNVADAAFTSANLFGETLTERLWEYGNITFSEAEAIVADAQAIADKEAAHV